MRKSLILPLGLLTLGVLGVALAQNTTPVPLNDNFRINVQTNREVYHYRDVLRLSVELLNDSSQVLHISRPDVLEPVEPDPDAGIMIPARLDDEPVDVVIEPEVCPIIIGWARLVPLYPAIQPTDRTDTAGISLEPVFERRIRLPLYGPTTTQPHSTRILSTATILIGWPVDVEPDPVEPDPAGTDVTIDRPQPIPVQTRIRPVRPGYYLLECNIDRIWGSPLAQAQKIIRIVGPRPRPIPSDGLLHENNRILKKLDERTEAMAAAERNIFSYVRMNNRYLQIILRYLIGYQPERPEPDPQTDTGTQAGPAAGASRPAPVRNRMTR